MQKLMQKKHLLIGLLLLCFAALLAATNTMEPMTTLYGENIGDQFGASIVVIDFNGDGLADVSIWIPLFGNNEKAFIWSDVFGEPELCEAYPITWINGVGDVNMDGYSDMVQYAITGPYDARQHDFTLYYGDEDITLSDSLLIGTSNVPVDQRLGALGDINGDGYPDLFAWTDVPRSV